MKGLGKFLRPKRIFGSKRKSEDESFQSGEGEGGGSQKSSSLSFSAVPSTTNSVQVPPLPPLATAPLKASTTNALPVKPPPKKASTTNALPVKIPPPPSNPAASHHQSFHVRPSTSNASPIKPPSLMFSSPLPELANLHDAALRDFLETKLSFAKGEVILVISLLACAPPPSPPATSSSSSFSATPSSKDLAPIPIYLLFTRKRQHDFHIHGVSSMFSLLFTQQVANLLVLTEDETDTKWVTLKFHHKTVTVCLNEEEKNWLFYCCTRLCREFCQNEQVSIVTTSNLRLRTNDEILKSKCPLLLSAPPPSQNVTIKLSTPAKTSSTETTTANNKTASPVPLFVHSPLEKVELNEIFPRHIPKGDLKDWIQRVEQEHVISGEIKTMHDLIHWEGAQGGRRNDPVANLLLHLETVETKLGEVEAWMTQTQTAVHSALLSAQSINKEFVAIRSETAFKQSLLDHLQRDLVVA